MTGPKPIESVVTGMTILELIAAQAEPMSLAELARRTGMTKPRVHRHLQTLYALGYLTQVGAGRPYSLTPKLRLIAESAPVVPDLLARSGPILADLCHEVRSTVTFATASTAGVEVRKIRRFPSLVQITTKEGAIFELANSAHGKVSLAFGPEYLRLSIEGEQLSSLEGELDRIHRRGWANAPGAVLAGINTIAVPVLDADGTLLGSIGALGSLDHIPADPSKKLLALLNRAAAMLAQPAEVERMAR